MMSYEEFKGAAKELQWHLEWEIKNGEKGGIRLAKLDILDLVIANPEYAERYIKESEVA